MVYIQVKGAASFFAEVTAQTFWGQCFKVTMGNFAALGDPAFQIGHLAQPQCCLDIGHSVVEAQHLLLVVPGAVRLIDKVFRIPGDAVAAQHAHGFGNCGVVGHCHAAFAGGDDLHRVEAENGDVAVAAVAGRLAVIAGAESVAGIFDDPKAVLLSQAMDLLHVAGQAREVYRDNHLGQASLSLGGYQLAL